VTHDEITKALASLAPNSEWTLTGDDYDTLVWLSDGKAPTLTQIEAEIDLFPAKQLAKIDARTALLAKLGITEDEAALLLGGN
jgi:hypothetical protein